MLTEAFIKHTESQIRRIEALQESEGFDSRRLERIVHLQEELKAGHQICLTCKDEVYLGNPCGTCGSIVMRL